MESRRKNADDNFFFKAEWWSLYSFFSLYFLHWTKFLTKKNNNSYKSEERRKKEMVILLTSAGRFVALISFDSSFSFSTDSGTTNSLFSVALILFVLLFGFFLLKKFSITKRDSLVFYFYLFKLKIDLIKIWRFVFLCVYTKKRVRIWFNLFLFYLKKIFKYIFF